MPNIPLDFDVRHRVKKRVKRLIFGAIVVLVTIGLICALGLALFRAAPAWYQLPQLTLEQREAAAQSATNKLAMIQNEAARLRAAERSGSATHPASAANRITVSFTDQELNAFFDKWSAWNNWKGVYERYLTDPVIVLKDGRLILAARVKELNSVASIHFRPKIDESGQFEMDLERVLGGRLPLPHAVLGDYRQRLNRSMQQQLPGWRSSAAVDRNGSPNTSAVCATMGSLLLKILQDEPADPILFVPLVERGSVMVKLIEVRIENRTLTLTVQPLSAAERNTLLRRIKQ